MLELVIQNLLLGLNLQPQQPPDLQPPPPQLLYQPALQPVGQRQLNAVQFLLLYVLIISKPLILIQQRVVEIVLELMYVIV